MTQPAHTQRWDADHDDLTASTAPAHAQQHAQQQRPSLSGAQAKLPHRADNPRIIFLDVETVPDARLYARALTKTQDPASTFAQARAAAERGDRDRMKELLGEDFKPGNAKKPELLIEALDKFEQAESGKVVKRLSVEPTTLAICCWAAYTEDPEPDIHGDANPTAAVCSWGTTEDRSGLAKVCGRDVLLQQYQTVDRAAGLLDMSHEEQWAAERMALLNLWGWLSQYAAEIASGHAILATFNGIDFDIPAIEHRSMRHHSPLGNFPGVRPTVRIKTNRYDTRPHLDVARYVWRGDRSNRNGCGLEESMARFGLECQKVALENANEVFPAACEARWGDIEAYNLGDVVPAHQAARMLILGGLA